LAASSIGSGLLRRDGLRLAFATPLTRRFGAFVVAVQFSSPAPLPTHRI
jgi:hypothetical protein